MAPTDCPRGVPPEAPSGSNGSEGRHGANAVYHMQCIAVSIACGALWWLDLGRPYQTDVKKALCTYQVFCSSLSGVQPLSYWWWPLYKLREFCTCSW